METLQLLSRSEMKTIKGGYINPDFPGYKCCKDGDPSNCTACANNQLRCTGVVCNDGWHCTGVSDCESG